jgi:thiamine pyrophosphate-dependent acetolactate synthase large subunit-like protein
VVFEARHALSLEPTERNGASMAKAACRNAEINLALGTRFDDRDQVVVARNHL